MNAGIYKYDWCYTGPLSFVMNQQEQLSKKLNHTVAILAVTNATNLECGMGK